MKYASVMIVLIAMGAAGCGDSEPDQTEPEKNASGETAAEETKRILEAIAKNRPPKSVKPPGFFGGGSSSGRRKDDPEDQDTDPDLLVVPPESATQPARVKRPPPKPVTPDQRAAKQVKLAELYLANAAAAPTPAGREFLTDKAATILKEIIAKHPKAPATTEATRLLKEIEAAQ
ncbi:MAG: hypothetical protein QGH60_24295 [Phycisphaerae bacterium]|jgi:hypothetical protein|nr:hypothetical protein [Phycisphaerae bacterium]